jgi:uncharacterized DUF497 family protein
VCVCVLPLAVGAKGCIGASASLRDTAGRRGGEPTSNVGLWSLSLANLWRCSWLLRRDVPDAAQELLVTEVGLGKLGARGISAEEATQVLHNRHAIVRNPHAGTSPGRRRLLIGTTDGGRVLTVVIEQTMEPTTWLVVTGWSATPAERRIIQANT